MRYGGPASTALAALAAVFVASATYISEASARPKNSTVRSVNDWRPIPGSVFVEDKLPDGCSAYAVVLNGEVQDLYRADKSRLLLRAPCGAVTHTYTTTASGDRITVRAISEGEEAVFKWDGDIGLVGHIIQSGFHK